MIGYGWMAKRDLPPEIDGIAFDPHMPTRREEYRFVRDIAVMLGQGVCVDAGSGLTPSQHVMAYILGENGWVVYAIDEDLRGMVMPAHENVVRMNGDMTDTGLPDGMADLVICVSVLEHCGMDVRLRFASEARRLLRPGGYLVVTADEIEPRELAGLFIGMETGKEQEPEDDFQHLGPRVSYCVARRV